MTGNIPVYSSNTKDDGLLIGIDIKHIQKMTYIMNIALLGLLTDMLAHYLLEIQIVKAIILQLTIIVEFYYQELQILTWSL